MSRIKARKWSRRLTAEERAAQSDAAPNAHPLASGMINPVCEPVRADALRYEISIGPARTRTGNQEIMSPAGYENKLTSSQQPRVTASKMRVSRGCSLLFAPWSEAK